MKRNTIVAIMITFCFTASIFMIIPIRSATSPYNPWIDSNDDGKISLADLVLLANSYGTTGTPLTKASIQYDSGWINITDKSGQNIVITHNLNSTDLIVEIQGKTALDTGPHQKYFGGTDFVAGWNKTYGGTGHDFAEAVIQTFDGGYAIAGYTDSFGAGASDFWLIKTDASGNEQWNKTYGGTIDESAYCLMQTSDGGYTLGGVTTSFGAGNYEAWLVKTDANGNEQWNKTYGGTNMDWINAFVQTADGGYALACWTNSFGAGNYDFWLIKTDAGGNMQWNKTYGGTKYESAWGLVQTGDGGYALAGCAATYPGGGPSDFWLVKTDANGNQQWNKTYGGTGDNYAYSVVQTSDGGYALAGRTTFGAGSFDFWLVKTDASGNEQWNKTYGGTGVEAAYFGLVQTGDGGYALAGWTNSFGAGNYDFWVVKTDANGNMQWNKTYGGTSDDRANNLIQTADGGYAIAGYVSSFGAGLDDAWLIKTDAAGNAVDGFKYGLAWVDSTPNTIELFRGTDDEYWNYVQVRLWEPKTP